MTERLSVFQESFIEARGFFLKKSPLHHLEAGRDNVYGQEKGTTAYLPILLL